MSQPLTRPVLEGLSIHRLRLLGRRHDVDVEGKTRAELIQVGAGTMTEARGLAMSVALWVATMAFAGWWWDQHGREWWHRLLTRLKTGSWDTL